MRIRIAVCVINDVIIGDNQRISRFLIQIDNHAAARRAVRRCLRLHTQPTANRFRLRKTTIDANHRQNIFRNRLRIVVTV